MKIIFLDRDGVINKYPGHGQWVTDQNEFEFIPGALDAIKMLSENDFKIFVLSNQSGVSKGIYAQEELDYITWDMIKQINKKSGKIEKAIYCTHTDEDNCNCRKPKPGLIYKALDSLGLKECDLSSTFFVGDSIRDIKTGKSAGCKTILVFSGKETIDNKDNWELKPDYTAKDLLEAVKIILNENPNNLCHGRSGSP